MKKIKARVVVPYHIQNLIVEEHQRGGTQAEIAKDWNLTIRQIRTILYNHGHVAHPDNSNVAVKGSNTAVKSKTKGNILFIPDLHAPFVRDGFLEFCIAQYIKWECDEVYFLGDLIDNHYSSFHDTDPDGLSASAELDKAIEQLQEFYEAFPVARVVLGNHDNVPNRKAFNAGLSKRWIRSVDEALDVPEWEFAEHFWIDDNTLVCHGMGRVAHNRMRQDMVNVIQGHYHTKSYIQYQVGSDRKTYAMQLGCGMDNNTYAAAYGKWFSRPQINIGVLLEGKTPIIVHMDL